MSFDQVRNSMMGQMDTPNGNNLGVPIQGQMPYQGIGVPSEGYYVGNETPTYGTTGEVRSIGGIVAHQMRQNPYMTATGKFRKPRQDEIIKEIRIFKGMPTNGKDIRIEDMNRIIRHVCKVKPYFHVLSGEKYAVKMPISDLEVVYYVHRECNTLFVVTESLSD